MPDPPTEVTPVVAVLDFGSIPTPQLIAQILAGKEMIKTLYELDNAMMNELLGRMDARDPVELNDKHYALVDTFALKNRKFHATATSRFEIEEVEAPTTSTGPTPKPQV